MPGDSADELERFRQQWQEEVIARSRGAPSTASSNLARPPRPPRRTSGPAHSERGGPSSFHKPVRDTEEKSDDIGGQGYHDLKDKDEARRLGEVGERIYPSIEREPRSALEHYERACEREAEGSLGDSLNHYRKAFRLDAGVDRIYKNKHFPPSSFKPKPTNPNPSNAPITVPNPAHHSLDGPPASSNISQLIASFSALSISAEEPPTDRSPAPLCPISTIPSEILTDILLQTAVIDVASFARLSVVCKHLAYLVTTEDRIWKRICLGLEFGFAAMHYRWACSISGKPLPISLDDLEPELSSRALATPSLESSFPLSPTYPTHRHMFYSRSRLRFNGCYISTVNYIRPGGNSASQITWNTPVHIVTYYRYLRFFRDGTCVSLLTTTEPADVVHYITKENTHVHHAGGLPSSVMNHALRGRWKLSGDPHSTADEVQKEEDEGTIHIETEGADAGHPNPKYIYKMMLQLKSAGRVSGATRNNKLAWLKYWSYNKLTDDWAEFGLKNDKAFYWSRVRSFGLGE